MYTIKPTKEHAKAYGRDINISTKHAVELCKHIRNKKLSAAKQALRNLINKKTSLKGKYYTKTSTQLLELLESCEKNADYMGLEKDKLKLHASANNGTTMRRRRRKAAYGSRLKRTNVEMFLIEGER